MQNALCRMHIFFALFREKNSRIFRGASEGRILKEGNYCVAAEFVINCKFSAFIFPRFASNSLLLLFL